MKNRGNYQGSRPIMGGFRVGWVSVLFAGIGGIAAATAAPGIVRIGNELVERELTADGQGHWLTTKVTAGSESLEIQSDEFHIRMMDGREFTVMDFVTEKAPIRTANGLNIHYVWPVGKQAAGGGQPSLRTGFYH